MAIRFRCQHCERDIELPDEAGGRRNKCPFCSGSNYVPAPVAEDELLDIAPIDEAEERRRQQEVQQLLEQEREIIKELKTEPHVPLKQRSDLKTQDIYHLVVNYCLDIRGGNLKRAERTVMELAEYTTLSLAAIEDFISGKAAEPALKSIPPRVLQGFLVQLRDKVKQFWPEQK